MRKFSIYYKDEQELVHAQRTNVAFVKFGSMVETEDGFIMELPTHPNTKFYVKEDKEQVVNSESIT